MGYAGILYANAALQAAMLAMKAALAHLAADDSLAGAEENLIGFLERQEAVKFSTWNDVIAVNKASRAPQLSLGLIGLG